MIKVVAIDFVGVLVRERDIELDAIEDKLERMFGDNYNDIIYDNKAKQLTNESISNITLNIFDKLYEPIDKNIFLKLKKEFNNIIFIVASNHVSYVKEYISKTFNNLDDIVISAEIGSIKPNKEFYEYILNKHNIKPNELLFIDDNIDNVNGASIIGINTIKVDKTTDLFKELYTTIKNINN